MKRLKVIGLNKQWKVTRFDAISPSKVVCVSDNLVFIEYDEAVRPCWSDDPEGCNKEFKVVEVHEVKSDGVIPRGARFVSTSGIHAYYVTGEVG